MDVQLLAEALTQVLAPLLPYLVKGGETLTEEVAKHATEEGWKKGKALWGKLRGKVEAKPAAQEAVEDLVAAPGDADSLAALRKQLRKILEADGGLQGEVTTILGSSFQAEVRGSGVVLQGVGNAGASGGGVAVAGNVGTLHLHASSPSSDDARTAYLAWVAEEARLLSLSGIDPAQVSGGEAAPQLDAIYTALLTQTPLREIQQREAISHSKRDGGGFPSALAHLDRHPHLALLGDPGSGKSTFVNFVAYCLATGELDLLTAPLPDPETGKIRKKRQIWKQGPLLPVRVILRDFAAQELGQSGQRGSASLLWQFIESTLERACKQRFAVALQKELEERGGLLLLDGFDEVPEAEEQREQLKEAVEAFARSFSRCRILLTSRTYAYQNQSWRLEGFREAVLAPWNDGQIRRFVDLWYRQPAVVRRSEGAAADRAAQLERAIFSNDRLLRLARGPLLLTLIASLHAWRRGSLPEDREELYDQAVHLLLDLWERPRWKGNRLLQPSLVDFLKIGGVKRLRQALEEVAFQAHAAPGDQSDTADIPEGALLESLNHLAPGLDPNQLFAYVRDRAGLLIPRGVRVYAFPHRTFQEYLAACYLNGQGFPHRLAGLVRQEPGRWREVLLLSGAALARQFPDLIWRLIEALCPLAAGDPEATAEDVWGSYLAGQVVLESVKSFGELTRRDRETLERLRSWFVRLLGDPVLPALERAQAGRILARLGDSRPGVTSVEGMEFSTVPAGAFQLGDDARKAEISYAYRMARFPVTVGQFNEFASATESLERPEWLGDEANEPVAWVSWEDAKEFCRWLTAKWREEKRIAADWTVSLPSEEEWEKAARGADGRQYPWGNEEEAPERANCRDSGIRRVSTVGCFPSGASPYGCEEMAGNVWEWTRSRAGEEEELRVLRGGSYIDHSWVVRCAYRIRNFPDPRLDLLGFRVVLLPFSPLNSEPSDL